MDSRTMDWGTLPYTEAFQRQLAAVEDRIHGLAGDRLFFVEHPPVYTLGARKDSHQHLLLPEEIRTKAGIDLVQSNRGGDITYHGPGQIVGYPILSLGQSRDLHAYLRNLEEVLIRTLRTLGISPQRREGLTGIWIEDRKIAAIGVAVKSWVTYHGFALNVNPDMSHFAGIVPCGITDGRVTSLEEEMVALPSVSEIKSALSLEFWKLFKND